MLRNSSPRGRARTSLRRFVAVADLRHTGAKGDVRVQEPTRSERIVARRSAESRATVPDLEFAVEVEMEATLAACRERRVELTAALVRACALALRAVPRANGAYRDGHFELYSRVNVGVVLTPGDDYVVTTVFDADTTALVELGKEIARLRQRAATGELSSAEVSGATFTLFEAGALGIDSSTPLLIPPQAAAASAGTVRERAVVRDGAIVPSHMMTLRLACDHRILYGAHAAKFLSLIKSHLEEGSL